MKKLLINRLGSSVKMPIYKRVCIDKNITYFLLNERLLINLIIRVIVFKMLMT